MSTPTIPEAQAAYDRVLALDALPADPQLLIDAIGVPGMPSDIVTLGTAINASKIAHAAWMAAPSPATAGPWELADAALKALVLPV